MMNKTLLLAASAAAFTMLATPASAAPVSGARIEALVGYDSLSASLEDDGIDADLDQNGIVFGIGAGYDFPVGATTSVGIDLEATVSTANAEFSEGTDSADLDAGRDLYAGVRLTTAVSDSVNLFFGAGYTNQRISATVTNGFDIESDSANAEGVRGRAGLQFSLGTSAYATVEYRYSNYEADLSRHQAVGGIGFRF
jgi:outer membrane immunogenic protein